MGTNLHENTHRVPVSDKNKLYGHQSPVLWLTGLSGSGKSTIANELESRLFTSNIRTHVLDGDNVRMGLNKDLGFSDEGRKENIRRISEVANLFSDSGTLTITAFISPFEEDRNSAREIIGEDNFIEIFIDTDLEICEERDPKGLYKKARAGEITNFTGIDSPYESPTNPSLCIDAGNNTVENCVNTIIDYLTENKFIGSSLKEVSNLDKRKTVSIDFDGVIHKYSKGFQGLDNAYDPPMDDAIESMERLVEEGFIIKILSSRPKEVIYPWLEKYGISHLVSEVSNHKFPATIYIDDRGYHFKDWESTMTEIYEHPKMTK